MKKVQIVLDRELLRATDRAARRSKQTRSALIRFALREHLRRVAISAREERESAGYTKRPQQVEEARRWEAELVWPE